MAPLRTRRPATQRLPTTRPHRRPSLTRHSPTKAQQRSPCMGRRRIIHLLTAVVPTTAASTTAASTTAASTVAASTVGVSTAPASRQLSRTEPHREVPGNPTMFNVTRLSPTRLHPTRRRQPTVLPLTVLPLTVLPLTVVKPRAQRVLGHPSTERSRMALKRTALLPSAALREIRSSTGPRLVRRPTHLSLLAATPRQIDRWPGLRRTCSRVVRFWSNCFFRVFRGVVGKFPARLVAERTFVR